MTAQEDVLKNKLDTLYRAYNKIEFIRYDPIKYVHEFENQTEKELIGLISSSFSFGRVTQIFKAMDSLLDIFHKAPLKYVLTLKKRPDKKLLSFKYRFVTGMDIFHLLLSAKRIIEGYGSIGKFVSKKYKRDGFLDLVDQTIKEFQGVNYLIPSSLKNSACKRLLMFFRWMVRNDNIDLGLWEFISPKELVIPLDTHIFRTSKELGFTVKRSASLSTAIEITDNLKRYSADDPVRYDWALSHIGIIENNFVSVH